MYIFQADCYCDQCGERSCKLLDAEGARPENVEDESSFDSAEYPKRVGDDDDHGESDSPTHCCRGMYCLEGQTLYSGQVVGKLLGTDLTDEGVKYVVEYIQGGSTEVTRFWKSKFGEFYPEIAEALPFVEYRVVCLGNPWDGMSLWGPFAGQDAASEWMEGNRKEADCWIMDVSNPND